MTRPAPTLALVCLAAALAAGCQSTPPAREIKDPAVSAAADEQATNQRCTFTGYEVNPRYNVSYKGETIGFCSLKSQDMFLDLDEAGRDAVLREAVAPN
jgi:hypothetical protein